jgi:hypothetical protein
MLLAKLTSRWSHAPGGRHRCPSAFESVGGALTPLEAQVATTRCRLPGNEWPLRFMVRCLLTLTAAAWVLTIR